jgi:hypothetical protein
MVPSAATSYSAPAPGMYQAPTQGQRFVGSAPLVAGSAPPAGSRIKPADRADIIEELRKDYKEAGTDSTRRERRKTLRDSAKTKFAEAIGDDAEGLNEVELQDIDNIVNSIVDPSPYGSTPGVAGGTAVGYAAPTTVTYAPGYAPSVLPTSFIQPVVPVQVWVPVYAKPKHSKH